MTRSADERPYGGAIGLIVGIAGIAGVMVRDGGTPCIADKLAHGRQPSSSS